MLYLSYYACSYQEEVFYDFSRLHRRSVFKIILTFVNYTKLFYLFVNDHYKLSLVTLQ